MQVVVPWVAVKHTLHFHRKSVTLIPFHYIRPQINQNEQIRIIFVIFYHIYIYHIYFKHQLIHEKNIFQVESKLVIVKKG